MRNLRAVALSCVIMVLLNGGCTKGPFTYVSMCDYGIFEGDLYLLVERVEGIDKSTRFDHGSKNELSRKVFGIARCRLIETSDRSIELLGTRQFTDRQRLWADGPLLCSTNSFALAVDAQTFEVHKVDERAQSSEPKMLRANRIGFSCSRQLMFGCGNESWAVNTSSPAGTAGVITQESLRMLCDHWTNRSTVATSDDMATIIVQSEMANPPHMRIVNWDPIVRTNDVALPEVALRLHSVHGNWPNAKVLFSSFNSNGRQIALLLDMLGKELGRAEVAGKPAADVQCTKVVSLSQGIELKRGDNLAVKVWLPTEGREFVLSFDTSRLLTDLDSRMEP